MLGGFGQMSSKVALAVIEVASTTCWVTFSLCEADFTPCGADFTPCEEIVTPYEATSIDNLWGKLTVYKILKKTF